MYQSGKVKLGNDFGKATSPPFHFSKTSYKALSLDDACPEGVEA